MSAKKWISIWTMIVLLFPLVGIFNYFVDPYGLKSQKNKYIETLTYGNNPNILNLKLNLKADYYFIGSSRLMRIDPRLFSQYFPSKNVYNVNISGTTFKENLLVTTKVKKYNKNFIFGLDPFTLNANRYSSGEIVSRYNSYKSALSNDSTIAAYLSINYLQKSFKYIKKRIKKMNFNEFITQQNRATGRYDIKYIEEHTDLANNAKKNHFTNFQIISDAEVMAIAKLATKDDIFVIYPQYYIYYALFQKDQGIEKQYFHALELLVNNTKAKVWSFYGINDITIEKFNFDDKGWHFKPKISNLIFAKMFDTTKNSVKNGFGTLLNKKTIHIQLEKFHNEVQSYFKKESINLKKR